MSLTEQHSAHKNPKLTHEQVQSLLSEVPGYTADTEQRKISKEYGFDDFYETMAFVNALAFIANNEDHHPDLEVSYKTCRVTYSTHDAGGLTQNDFICAAKIDALVNHYG